MFSCKLSIFFNLPKNEKIRFSLGRPLKCPKEEKPIKIRGCWKDLYLNQFSLLWPFTGCSMLVLCCLLVSDDVKSKLLPLMHIHYELEDLVSWQLQIPVTQKSKVFAGGRVQWLPWLWLHNSFHSIPQLYNSVFSKLLTFGLIFPFQFICCQKWISLLESWSKGSLPVLEDESTPYENTGGFWVLN